MSRVNRGVRLAVVCLIAGAGSLVAATKPDPKTLVTPAEASALLGGSVTFEAHDMDKVYPGSLDFSYQTKSVRILSVAVDPLDGPEKLSHMKRDLKEAHPNAKQAACSVGDACFMQGEDLFATKGKWYIHLSAGRESKDKIEDLARKVVSRLP
jgi:hypothetical protein